MFIIACSLIFFAIFLAVLWQLNMLNLYYVLFAALLTISHNALYLIEGKKEKGKLREIVKRLKRFNEGLLGEKFDDIKGSTVGNLCQEIHKVTQNTRHLVGELSIAS